MAAGNSSGAEGSWDRSYPYEVDYCDHFETPLIAYEDIAPLLDWLVSEEGISRKEHVIYDPYYCNGRTSMFFQKLGFQRIINRKRDFYKDYEASLIPFHHTFITNPPYSEHHKIRCLDIAFSQLRKSNNADNNQRPTPFFVLMPNYVAAREYFRSRANQQQQQQGDVCFLIPSKPYEYCHPEGTGKKVAPFSSLWFCGIGKKKMAKVKLFWDNLPWTHHDRTKPRLVTSLDELKALGAIPTEKRGNPRQRRKRRQHAAAAEKQQQQQSSSSSGIGTSKTHKKQDVVSRPENNLPASNHQGNKNKRSKSKYRDGTGARKRKRF